LQNQALSCLFRIPLLTEFIKKTPGKQRLQNGVIMVIIFF